MSQLKSKERVTDHGEVFTSPHEVNCMLNLVKRETERIDSRFLEPACGNGNFLAEVLIRKLTVVANRYKKNQLDYERYAIIAISSIYGIDILEDNVSECRERLFNVFNEQYCKLYKAHCKNECLQSTKFLLNRNILCGNALDFTVPNTREPIVFSEWSMVKGSFMKRRDYLFKVLIQKQSPDLFAQKLHSDDPSRVVYIPQPIGSYPVMHFLKLTDYAKDKLQP